MRTSDLIAALAVNPAPAPRHAVARRMAPAVIVGIAASFALLLAAYPLRPLSVAVHTAPFWMKALYTASLAAIAWLLVDRAARPGARLGHVASVLAAPVAVMIVLGLMQLGAAAPDARMKIWLGHSWSFCPGNILMLAAPIFVACVVAVRQLAPTRLVLAGAGAGLLAGALSATVYGLACRETSAAFVATWYTLGIAVCAAIGAALGPRLLRW
jgi:hypothetical protein